MISPTYAYGLNNPNSFSDSTGLHALSDACSDALDDARRIAAEIRKKFNFGDCNGYIDYGHQKKIRQLQSALEKALKRVRLYCGPSAPELPEWEQLANRNPGLYPGSLKPIQHILPYPRPSPLPPYPFPVPFPPIEVPVPDPIPIPI